MTSLTNFHIQNAGALCIINISCDVLHQ